MGHAMFDKFPLAAKALRGYQQTGYGVEISAFFQHKQMKIEQYSKPLLFDDYTVGGYTIQYIGDCLNSCWELL